jgi:RHS repeat-associated protein
VWLGDLPVAALEPTGAFYIAPDHLGAPHQITDGSVNAVWYWDHDPFGNGTPSGSFSYNLRFPGQFYDQNAKLHYNYYRDYDPNTGRYIESDPIGLNGGINTYAYALNNPAVRTDPLGLVGVSIGPITISPTPPFISVDIPKAALGDSADVLATGAQRAAEAAAYNAARNQMQKDPNCPPKWERDALKKLGEDINNLTKKINDMDAKLPNPGNFKIDNGWIPSPGSLGPAGAVGYVKPGS